MSLPAFTSGEELSTFTGGRVTTGARADMMVAQASGVVRAYCGWHVWPPVEDDVVTVDGSGALVQPLPTLHLVGVSEVTSDGQAVTDFEWSQAGFLRLPGGRWTRKLRGVVATIDHGLAEVPPEIQAVCLQVAARAVVNPTGASSEAAGGVSVSYQVPGGLNDLEMAVLDRYRVSLGP